MRTCGQGEPFAEMDMQSNSQIKKMKAVARSCRWLHLVVSLVRPRPLKASNPTQHVQKWYVCIFLLYDAVLFFFVCVIDAKIIIKFESVFVSTNKKRLGGSRYHWAASALITEWVKLGHQSTPFHTDCCTKGAKGHNLSVITMTTKVSKWKCEGEKPFPWNPTRGFLQGASSRGRCRSSPSFGSSSNSSSFTLLSHMLARRGRVFHTHTQSSVRVSMMRTSAWLR